MEHPNPFDQIAALRVERGETLAQFALAVGISSKGRISEMEKGLVRPTVAQALAFEKLSGGRINAASLNADVAAARQSVIDDQSDPGSWADAIKHSPNMRVEEHSADRVVICDVCDKRVDQVTACTFVDCPHSERRAA